MKSLCLILGCLFVFVGCSTTTTVPATSTSPATTTTTSFIQKVEAGIENINWNNLLSYWQTFDAGLNELLPIIEIAFPGTTRIDGVIGKVASNANAAVNDLATAVTAVKAGTITEAQAQAIAADVKTQVMQANTTIGQAAYAAKKIVPTIKPATTPVPAAIPAVPTVSPTTASVPATK